VSDLPAGFRRTLAWDQGSEMSEHRGFSMATDMQVYFYDPASPWRRGTIENTNGLLRQYLPRRSDLRAQAGTTSPGARKNSTFDPAKPSTGTPPPNTWLLY